MFVFNFSFSELSYSYNRFSIYRKRKQLRFYHSIFYEIVWSTSSSGQMPLYVPSPLHSYDSCPL